MYVASCVLEHSLIMILNRDQGCLKVTLGLWTQWPYLCTPFYVNNSFCYQELYCMLFYVITGQWVFQSEDTQKNSQFSQYDVIILDCELNMKLANYGLMHF